MNPNNSNSQNRPWFPSHPSHPPHPSDPTGQQPAPPIHLNDPNYQTGPWFQQPSTHQEPPLPPPFVNSNPYVVQQPFLGSQTHTTPWIEASSPMQHYQSLPYGDGPVYQGVAQPYQHEYKPPSSGPSRNRHNKGHQKTEAQYKHHNAHLSSGTTARDHSTGIHPVHAQMDAFDNRGAGGAWRPPSENPSMVDYDSTQQMRTKLYKRDRAARSWNQKERTDKVDFSAYQIPIAESGRDATTGGSNIPVPTSAAAANTTNTYKQKQRMESDDFDTVSSGSDTN